MPLREGAGRPIVGADSETKYSGQLNCLALLSHPFCFGMNTHEIGHGRRAFGNSVPSIPRILPGGLTSVLFL